MSPELLAPGGSYEAACAALQYGADAVYVGLPSFSARADAPNISAEQLALLIAHAHSLTPGRRVHITLNTLVQDHELPRLIDAIALAADLRADALITQDLATAAIARRLFPRLPLHASTQMTAHNLDAVHALAGLGFSRIILARELSLPELRHIAARSPIELEIFIHGALCYAYSGLCLFSSLTTTRSGNRGRCAYSCRQAFQPPGGQPGHPFSMRDLCLLPLLDQLRGIPLASLKIEGRMKSPLYVAAVTDLYRRKLDNTLTPGTETDLLRNLQTIFSRPTTTLYAPSHQADPRGIIDPSATGHRGAPIGPVERLLHDGPRTWLRFRPLIPLEKHDGIQIDPPGAGRPIGFPVTQLRPAGSPRPVPAVAAGILADILLPPGLSLSLLSPGTPLYCAASQAVRRAYPVQLPRPSSLPVPYGYDLHAVLTKDQIHLRAQTGPVVVELTEPAALEPAADASRTPSAFRNAFSRTAPFPFELRTLSLDDPCGCFVPASLLNPLRRELLRRLFETRQEQLDAVAEAERCHWFSSTPPAPSSTQTKHTVKIPAHLQTDFPGADELILQLHHDHLAIPRPSPFLRLALPLVTRGHEEAPLDAFLSARLAAGHRLWEVPDLASRHRLHRLAAALGIDPQTLDITADWPLYALNRAACAQLASLGFSRRVQSPEDTAANLDALAAFPPALERLAFQHTPLLISETPPLPRDAEPLPPLRLLPQKHGQPLHTHCVDRRAITLAPHPFSVLPWQSPPPCHDGVLWLRCDFSFSPPDTPFADIWHRIRQGLPPENAIPGNLRLDALP